MTNAPTIVWFRQDLRLADNPALRAAIDRGGPVIPVFIWAPEEDGDWPPGAASRIWLNDSLQSLDRSLREKSSRLVIRSGPSLDVLNELIESSGASAVFWNRRYEPARIERDAIIKKKLRERGIEVQSFNAALLHEPWEIKTKSGGPFQVFTPFWNACLQQSEPTELLSMPRAIPALDKWPKSLSTKELDLEPTIDWAGGIREMWKPGERGAHQQLKRFLKDGLKNYDQGRDEPGTVGTSQLSPHLHFGEISPQQIWHAIGGHSAKSDTGLTAASMEQFAAELGWREFAHHLLYHLPHSCDRPLRENFNQFPWRKDARALKAWQKGQTGYPIVDAGMRQLWHVGWMHNRVRMIVASFLVKHLLLPWQEGARWFWDTLVDADLANNTLGWQWTAGCGTDAAPYFRIFNPTLQGEKFDANGVYVRRWVPEIAALPDNYIHQPWAAPPDVLRTASIKLGTTYPKPIVDHAEARERALAAFATVKQT